MKQSIPQLLKKFPSLIHVFQRLPQLYKFFAYGVIVFFAIIPFAFISFFQQTRLAQETVNELALSLVTVIHQSQDDDFSPASTIDWLQNHKLVLWARYYKKNSLIASAGMMPKSQSDSLLSDWVLDSDKSLGKQLPSSQFRGSATSEYRFILPLKEKKEGDRLELGVSYKSLFSAAQDMLILTSAFFFVAFIFLLAAAIFVDAYVSVFTAKVIRAIRFRSSLQEFPEVPRHLSPTFSTLMEALEFREDQVIDTRNTLETVFNGMKNGVAMISTELKIVLVNQYFRELLASIKKVPSVDSLVSQSCSTLSFDGQERSVVELCENALQTLSLVAQEVCVSGQSFVQEAYPLLDIEDKPIAVILHCRDVTNERAASETILKFNEELRRQLNEQKAQLVEAQQQLIQSARLAAVGELAGGVAHEINNPNGLILTGARYVLNRLQSEPPIPEYIVKYLTRISKQSERVAQIVSALLTYSRRQPQNKEPVQIENVVEDALELAGARFGNGKIQVVKSFAQNLPPVFGNRAQLGQVFINLFNNAVDAMPGGGKIEVTTDAFVEGENSFVRVQVRDTGEGIKPELLPRLTEPFFTTKPVGKGTGLGLSVSHGIVVEHNGCLQVENHPEGGANFVLIFPKHKDKL